MLRRGAIGETLEGFRAKFIDEQKKGARGCGWRLSTLFPIRDQTGGNAGRGGESGLGQAELRPDACDIHIAGANGDEPRRVGLKRVVMARSTSLSDCAAAILTASWAARRIAARFGRRIAYLADGVTENNLLAEYPQLTHDDVLAAIAYGAEAARERIIAVPAAG